MTELFTRALKRIALTLLLLPIVIIAVRYYGEPRIDRDAPKEVNGYLITHDADLHGADLSNATLEKTSLGRATYDSQTKLPFDDREASRRGMFKIHR